MPGVRNVWGRFSILRGAGLLFWVHVLLGDLLESARCIQACLLCGISLCGISPCNGEIGNSISPISLAVNIHSSQFYFRLLFIMWHCSLVELRLQRRTPCNDKRHHETAHPWKLLHRPPHIQRKHKSEEYVSARVVEAGSLDDCSLPESPLNRTD